MDSSAGLSERVAQLERRLRGAQFGAAVAVVVLVSYACLRAQAQTTQNEVLRVRGVVVEDAQGRARILIGAPVPEVAERKRKDPASGLVVLGEDGVDRLQIGHVGGPQMGGKLQTRVSPATGMMVCEKDGDERGGFGVFDNGQVGWGLDFDGGEGLVAIVDPSRKLAGLVLQGGTDANPGRAMLMTQNGETTFAFSDAEGKSRATVRVKAGEPVSLRVVGADGKESELVAPGQK
jgi:hypothetical protein